MTKIETVAERFNRMQKNIKGLSKVEKETLRTLNAMFKNKLTFGTETKKEGVVVCGQDYNLKNAIAFRKVGESTKETLFGIVDFQAKNHDMQSIPFSEVSAMLKKNFIYSLGRHTYVVSWCVGQIMQSVEHLSEEDKNYMIDKLENDYFSISSGEWKCDIESWEDLLTFLKKQNK